MVDFNQRDTQDSSRSTGENNQARASNSRTGSANMPPTPPDPQDGSTRLLSVTYSPTRNGQTLLFTGVISMTTDYDEALRRSLSALQRHLPPGSATQPRWLSIRVQISSGTTWAEFDPDLFSVLISQPGAELKLCEDESQPDVTMLPAGNKVETQPSESYLQFKVIAIGPSSVGKSMIRQCLAKAKEAWKDELEATLQPTHDVISRFMTTQGELIKVSLWDTAGMERFGAITRSYYNGVNGVLLVYNTAEPNALQECTEWLTKIRGEIEDGVPIMLVGNKIDLVDERRIQTTSGQFFAAQHGLLFAEVSAKQGTNVDYMFQRLVHDIFSKLKFSDKLGALRKTQGPLPTSGAPAAEPRRWYKC